MVKTLSGFYYGYHRTRSVVHTYVTGCSHFVYRKGKEGIMQGANKQPVPVTGSGQGE